jgi:hypothetical protein
VAAKAVSVPSPNPEPVAGKPTNDLFLLAIPIETFRLVSDSAAQRGMTFAQAIQQAVDNWVGTPAGPKLLMEQKEQ